MKVLIVTGELPHHKHLCVQLARSQNVVGILHPAPTRAQSGLLRRLRTRTRVQGLAWTILNAAGQASRRRMERRFEGQKPESLADCQAEAVRGYSSLARELFHFVADFGSDAALNLLETLAPDIVVCLGGPIYPKKFIEACPLVVNYHSGYSPLYNGASTIWFAFAHGHPHCCAGTLMLMNPEVDGGDILAHLLPEITPDDNPFTLFLKTTFGAPTVCNRLIQGLQEHRFALAKVRQGAPFFYYRSIDWSWHHALSIQRHLRRKTCAAFARSKSLVEYWRQDSDSAARELYLRTTAELVWDRP